MTKSNAKTLILGIGNTLMGDEGIGVHVVNSLEKNAFPENVKLLDGGTGSFLLLEPMQRAEKVILIDATLDGAKAGTIRRLQPRFSKDYPQTLTAHDIGLKDLIDAVYLMGKMPDVTLFAISIKDLQDLNTELSPELNSILPKVGQMILDEINSIS